MAHIAIILILSITSCMVHSGRQVQCTSADRARVTVSQECQETRSNEHSLIIVKMFLYMYRHVYVTQGSVLLLLGHSIQASHSLLGSDQLTKYRRRRKDLAVGVRT